MILDSIEVLWIARYDYVPGWKLEAHKHDFYQIIYVLDGKGKHQINQQSHNILADELFFIKPGEFHCIELDEDCHLKTLDIKYQIYDKTLVDEIMKLPSSMVFKEQKFKVLLESIRVEGLEKREGYKEFSSLYLYQLLLKLLRLRQEASPPSEQELDTAVGDIQETLASKVLDLIKNNYAKPLKLDEIAHSLGYNKNYLCEQFKRAFNSTPIRYLYIYRIQVAKDLIKYSDYSLKEIAKLTGFESIHHFTRLFRQYENISPGRWRDNEREGVRKDIYINDEFVNSNFTQRVK